MALKSLDSPDAPDPKLAAFCKPTDGGYVVGIGNLRVLITKTGDSWFAQGLEIDYAAEAATLADVKREFEEGLKLTLNEHVKVFQRIDNAVRSAPKEVWDPFLSDLLLGRYVHSAVTFHLNGVVEQLDYYEPKVA